MNQLEIRIDQSRLKQLVTLNQMIGLLENDLTSLRDVMGIFAINPETDDYFPGDEGGQILGNLTLEQIEEVSKNFVTAMKEAAVP